MSFEDRAPDLTTDAFPSAPRQNLNNTEDNHTEQIGEDASDKQRNTSQNFVKNNYPATNSVVNVINISNSIGTHIGPSYTVVNKQKTTKNNNSDRYELTREIQELFLSNNAVTTDDISEISKHLDESWRDVARALEYSNGEISNIVEDFGHSGLAEVKYQLLLDWLQNNGKKATVSKLASTLWQVNQKECVSRWSKLYKLNR